MPAPQEYTVEQVVSREEWQGNDGPMVTYEIKLAGEQVVRKGHVPAAKDPAPAAGGTVSGWADTVGKFGFATGGGGGGGGRGRGGGGKGGEKSFERNADHPMVMAQRLHTAALSAAIPVLNQLAEAGLVPITNPQDYFRQLERTTERLKATYPADVVARAAATAEEPAAAAPPAEPQQPQLATEPAAVAPAAASQGDGDIPF